MSSIRAFASLVLVLALTGAVADEPNPAKAEAELKAVRSQIEKMQADMERDAGKRDKLSKELEESEKTVGTARGELDKLRRDRAVHAARRAELASQRQHEQGELEKDRGALAGQLRAAYMIGKSEPFKLLLNQREPAELGRVLVYYQYFGRARAAQIAAIDAHLGELATLDEGLAAEEQRLAALEEQQQGELSRLQSARERRGRALVSLDAETKNRAQELDRLKDQQGGLEKLIRELRRALERLDKFPTDSKDAFAKLRGKLAWPVAGKLVASFGQTRAGGLKWDGVLLAGAQGTPVRAIYHGRVVYADWLSGLGLLTIIDHGDGYLSLYGHNERLFKEVGERVTAGDTIATLGDSGGRPSPGLYFEIRKGGHPIDPRPWFKSPSP
ncbi:MAG TPA: peptidoglycan DD-metalloendopeptidase family protein [Steroidobacteraceae bacterium]|jgi:murein hydrolase activator|nr:peptidoglycan DD-metalloendopeptidase family protein [Steroidobacteraceae bacterium]